MINRLVYIQNSNSVLKHRENWNKFLTEISNSDNEGHLVDQSNTQNTKTQNKEYENYNDNIQDEIKNQQKTPDPIAIVPHIKPKSELDLNNFNEQYKGLYNYSKTYITSNGKVMRNDYKNNNYAGGLFDQLQRTKERYTGISQHWDNLNWQYQAYISAYRITPINSKGYHQFNILIPQTYRYASNIVQSYVDNINIGININIPNSVKMVDKIGTLALYTPRMITPVNIIRSSLFYTMLKLESKRRQICIDEWMPKKYNSLLSIQYFDKILPESIKRLLPKGASEQKKWVYVANIKNKDNALIYPLEYTFKEQWIIKPNLRKTFNANETISFTPIPINDNKYKLELKAFISDITQDYSTDWNIVNYLGRIFPSGIYSGYSKTIAFNLKLIQQNSKDDIQSKIQKLIGFVKPNKQEEYGTFIGNILWVQLLYLKFYAILTNISIDVQVGENNIFFKLNTEGGIDKYQNGKPLMYDVNISLIVLPSKINKIQEIM